MLSSEQRRWRADKLGDLANYTIGATLIGQLLSNTFRLGLTIVGVAVTLLCFFYGNSQMKRIN
jgi:hypothetical protein